MNDRVADSVLQFADIARPRVDFEHREGSGIDAANILAETPVRHRKEMIDQERDIPLSFAERRQFDGERIEPVEEVLPELAGSGQVGEVLVGRGQDANVGLDRLVAAHAFELLILKDTQDFGLSGGRHIADFIEKERAAVGLLELADALAVRAGERSLLVPE